MAKQQKRHVQCYENSMQRHKLIHTVSTYFNIADVEKNPNATWEQALNQTQKPKHNASHKLSRGS